MLKNNPIRRFTIKDGETVTIGRTTEADIVLDNPSVSRIHAVVEMENGENYLTDIGSTNGSWVNGERISSRTWLKSGDEIMIGKFQMVDGSGDTVFDQQSRAVNMGEDPRTIYVPPKR